MRDRGGRGGEVEEKERVGEGEGGRERHGGWGVGGNLN